MESGKRIIVVGHAQERMAERIVSRVELEETIRNPDSKIATYPNAKSGSLRERHLKKFGRKTLCVVVEYRRSLLIAITAFWKT